MIPEQYINKALKSIGKTTKSKEDVVIERQFQNILHFFNLFI